MPSTAGDGAAGADQRHALARRDHALHQPGQRARQQIEDQKYARADAILDGSTEDPQEQHVAAEVQKTGVQELAGEQRQQLLARHARIAASAASTTRGTAPQRWTNASSAAPRKVSSYRNTSPHATMSARVTTGRRRLATLSPSGITTRPLDRARHADCVVGGMGAPAPVPILCCAAHWRRTLRPRRPAPAHAAPRTA